MARFKLKNRVRITTTTSGTGPYTIGNATAGYQAFAGFNNGDRFPYTAQYGSQWEIGCGEKQGTQILRHEIYSSTNGNAPVNWADSSPKFLFIDQIAEQVPVSPDGSISINDNFETGEIELQGFNVDSLTDAVLAGVDLKKVLDDEDTPTTLTLHNVRKIESVSDSSTITLDFSASIGSTKLVNIAGNRTLVFTNALLGQKVKVQLNYDTIGGRVVTWPNSVRWVNRHPPAFTPVSGGSDTFEFERISETGYQFEGNVISTERPVILESECSPDVTATIDVNEGVASGPNEFQWLTATIDSDYNDYTLSKTGTVTGGTFDLTIGLSPSDNQTITNIPYNATAFELLTLIWANTTLDETEINVDGLVDGAGSTRTISSDGDIHLQFLGSARYVGYVITTDSTNLTGGGSYDVDVLPSGSGSDTWPFSGGATYSGSVMKFRFNGVDSASVAVNASESTIETAIGNITGIGLGNIRVKRRAIGSYYFEFIGSLRGTNVAHELQFTPGFLPNSSLGSATGQLYSTARNGAGPQGRNEEHTLTIIGSPTQGTITLTLLPGDPDECQVTFAVDATANEIETLINAALGSGSVNVTGGPLPDSYVIIEFIGDYADTNVPTTIVDASGAGSEDIDWSVCDAKVITLLPGNGTYTLRHVNGIPGKYLNLIIVSDGASGDIEFSDSGAGITVDWGVAGVPIVPPDGERREFRFRCETTSLIRGERRWVDQGYTVIEVRTDDPVDLVEGRMWVRSDL